MSLSRICTSLNKYDNFLIAAHTSPEGDALGAQLGFYNLIKKLGKKAIIVSDDKLPYGYDFLPGVEHIFRLSKKHRYIKFDCLVVLDCADLKRAGGVYKLNIDNKPVLNIDHHISNRFFGDINWVDSRASSCSEMIYRLYKKFRLPIDKETALVLYTGMMTDTGSFHYSNTTSFTFTAAAELLKSGLNVAQAYRQAYENIPSSDIKLLLKLLAKIKFFNLGKIAVFEIKKSLLKGKKVSIDLADHVLSFGRAIKDVEVVVLFKENLGANRQVRVNLRSQGKVDVNRVAANFGGGGHKTAAGCTLSGRINQVEREVLAKIQQFF